MHKTKKYLLGLLAILIVFTNTPISVATQAEAEPVSLEEIAPRTESLLVANPETEEIYYSKNPELVVPVASISKLMTYVVVKDAIAAGTIALTDKVVIDKDAAALNIPGYSRMELKVGEELSVEDLLAGLMIVSANDAAVALAKHVAGTEEDFVIMMNDKAKNLNLNSSAFINASGITNRVILEDDETEGIEYNQMSALELLTLTKYLVNTYPEVEAYGEMKQLVMPERDFIGEHTHSMYDRIKGLKGLKTGYTEEALFNFVGYVDMNEYSPGQDYRLITVVTGAHTDGVRRRATEALINYVDQNYHYSDLLGFDNQYPIVDYQSNNTEPQTFPLYLESPLRGVFPVTMQTDIRYELDYDKQAPYEDGEVLGKVIVHYRGEDVGQVNLINKGYKPKLGFFAQIYESLKELIKSIMIIF